MKILFIHNSYSDKTPTGEEHASRELAALLEEHGHEVRWFKRSSDEITGKAGAIKAFFTGIYNPSSAKALAKVLDDYQPEVVQVQNLYPFISTSIFKPLKKRGVPVVMRCPNYRLFCPNGLCLDSKGQVCEKCWGKGREWWCVKGNCEGSFSKSLGYALRNRYARRSRNILNGVDVFIVQSEFQKNKFIGQGILERKIGILPGISPDVKQPENDVMGDWVSFVGRVSAEKGIYEFIEAAKLNPTIPFKVAGSLDKQFSIPKDLPANVEFVGFLKGDALNEFYLKSRIIVVPSKWYEGFPNVILRGFMLGRPVITTNIGAMQSIVETGKDGILVEPGSVDDLSAAIADLYPEVELCKQYGAAGQKKAETLYSREHIYEELIGIYNQAKENKKA